MSDTPRTEVMLLNCNGPGGYLDVVALANFARQLERELAAAKAEIEQLEEDRTEDAYRYERDKCQDD